MFHLLGIRGAEVLFALIHISQGILHNSRLERLEVAHRHTVGKKFIDLLKYAALRFGND